MASLLENIFSSPRTTLAGLLGAILAPIGMYLVPAAVNYLGGQPGLGWKVLGLLLGAAAPALMRDRAAPK